MSTFESMRNFKRTGAQMSGKVNPGANAKYWLDQDGRTNVYYFVFQSVEVARLFCDEWDAPREHIEELGNGLARLEKSYVKLTEESGE